MARECVYSHLSFGWVERDCKIVKQSVVIRTQAQNVSSHVRAFVLPAERLNVVSLGIKHTRLDFKTLTANLTPEFVKLLYLAASLRIADKAMNRLGYAVWQAVRHIIGDRRRWERDEPHWGQRRTQTPADSRNPLFGKLWG